MDISFLWRSEYQMYCWPQCSWFFFSSWAWHWMMQRPPLLNPPFLCSWPWPQWAVSPLNEAVSPPQCSFSDLIGPLLRIRLTRLFSRGFTKGWFCKRVVLAHVPQNENQNEGTFCPMIDSDVPRNENRNEVRSHVPPEQRPERGNVCQNHPKLQNRPFVSSRFSLSGPLQGSC